VYYPIAAARPLDTVAAAGLGHGEVWRRQAVASAALSLQDPPSRHQANRPTSLQLQNSGPLE
jgi:hypothetical protein